MKQNINDNFEQCVNDNFEQCVNDNFEQCVNDNFEQNEFEETYFFYSLMWIIGGNVCNLLEDLKIPLKGSIEEQMAYGFIILNLLSN